MITLFFAFMLNININILDSVNIPHIKDYVVYKNHAYVIGRYKLYIVNISDPENIEIELEQWRNINCIAIKNGIMYLGTNISFSAFYIKGSNEPQLLYFEYTDSPIIKLVAENNIIYGLLQPYNDYSYIKIWYRHSYTGEFETEIFNEFTENITNIKVIENIIYASGDLNSLYLLGENNIDMR